MIRTASGPVLTERNDEDLLFAGPGPDQVFHDALSNGEFRIQQCRVCARHVFYPRALCPECGAPDPVWVMPRGRGVVYSTTVIRRKAEKGGDYNVAIIDLAEGPRLMSRVEDIPPEQVTIGMRVVARINRFDRGALLVFIPEEQSQ